MNILYISKLEGNDWQGPTHSVPNQIHYQSKYDNVKWINICNTKKIEWFNEEYFEVKNIKKISDLEKPFDEPDIVVFQGVYEYPFSPIVYDLWKRKIPYVIVPRSALTEDAQAKKKYKKKIFNYIFFNKFISRAISIQYLTLKEYQESSNKWNKNHFIEPNGIEFNKKLKTKSNVNSSITLSYIGRLEIYQKGLDLLIKACESIKKELLNNNVKIELYGPDREGTVEKLNELLRKTDLFDIIHINKGVFGTEKENVYKNTDVFIMTSRFEGLPMGLIEALSYGIPCFVTSGTNLKEEIVVNYAGWGCEGTVSDISKTLIKLINDKSNFDLYSKNAKKLSEKYDWDSIAKDTHKEYKKMINN